MHVGLCIYNIYIYKYADSIKTDDLCEYKSKKFICYILDLNNALISILHFTMEIYSLSLWKYLYMCVCVFKLFLYKPIYTKKRNVNCRVISLLSNHIEDIWLLKHGSFFAYYFNQCKLITTNHIQPRFLEHRLFDQRNNDCMLGVIWAYYFNPLLHEFFFSSVFEI